MTMEAVPTRGGAGRALDDAFNVYRTVMSGVIVILKGAVAPDECRRARDAVHAWGQTAPPTRDNALNTRSSVHLTSYLPPRSESRYIFHNHEFYLGEAGKELGVNGAVRPIFERLQKIYRELTDDKHEFTAGADRQALLPQCIQYPQGGGFFQEHVHDIVPQQIGLILAASEIGVDYELGSVRFRKDGRSAWINTEGQHRIGDVCLFRYDMLHDITPVDPHVPLDWSKNSGRWSFVLPIKPLPQV